jgi:ribosomal protein L22
MTALPIGIIMQGTSSSDRPVDAGQLQQEIQQQITKSLAQAGGNARENAEVARATAEAARANAQASREIAQQVRDAEQHVRQAEQQLRNAHTGDQRGAAAQELAGARMELSALRSAEGALRGVEGALRGVEGGQLGVHTSQPPMSPRELMPQFVDVAYGFFIMCAVIVIGWPLARAFGRRLERRAQTALPDAATSQQLQRIEQAVEAMAIEVERISESQRFMAKLQQGAGDGRALPIGERR